MSKATIGFKIKTFLLRLTVKKRERYQLQKQRRLKNTAPTIIGNNCVCGAMYQDLNLRYTSPTTNVLIPAEDFFRFVNDLEYYLTCPLEETYLEGISYPVGVLRKGDAQVILHFLHDRTFEAAKEKWVRRCGRVDLENLYIVFSSKIYTGPLNKWYKKFKQIKYPNKRMVVIASRFYDKEVVCLPMWAFSKNISSIAYPTKYSKKRIMDHFDYVSFLNKNESKKGL